MATASDGWIGLAPANGRYHITSKLGEGGMGTVYRAEDRNIGADVVIKVPLRKMLDDPGFAGRFKDEIRSLVRLSHPHIVKVSDVGEWEGLPFAVMQYLPGGSLEDRRQAVPAELPRWLTAIAEALDYVHTQSYVHRDVKPGNILFDNQGHAFLGDFGVVKVLAVATDAKSARASMTGAGMLIGTPEYMAPELIMGEPFDGRVDQYALAVTAYEMLSGRRPFEDDVKTRVLVLQTTQAPRPLADFCSWVPPQLSQAVLKGMAKDPKQRYSNCAALAEAVRAAVEAAPPDSAERVRLRCPSCSRKIGLAPHDFVKLRRSGRRVACPNCQARIEITDAVAAGPEATPGGHETGSGSGSTMALPVPDLRSQAANIEPRRTMVGSNRATPTAAEGYEQRFEEDHKRPNRTVVEQPAPPGAGGKPANRTVIEPSTTTGAGSRRGSPTVVESAGLAAAGPNRASPALIERPGSPDVPVLEPVGRSGVAPLIWISAGVAGTALLAGLVGVILLMRAPATRTKIAAASPEVISPAVTSARSQATPSPAATPPPDQHGPGDGAPGPMPQPGRSSAPIAPRTVNFGLGPMPFPNSAPDPSAATGPNPGPGVSPAPPAHGDTPDAAGNSASGTMVARSESFANLSPRPPSETKPPEPETDPDAVVSTVPTRKGSVALEKILGDPGLYANQVVELSQSYCMGDVASRRPDGSLSLPVIESRLDLDYNKGTCVVRRRKSFNLDLDATLSQQLLRLARIRVESGSTADAPRWDNSPAIVTVKIASRGSSAPGQWACRIVKFEFYRKFECLTRTVGYKKKLKVIYHTQSVSVNGEELGTGDPEEWSDLNRLGHLQNQLQKVFDSLRYQESQTKWNQINSLISATIQRGAQQAAANSAAEEVARERAIFGR